MTLSERQQDFTRMVSQLLAFAYTKRGMSYVISEVERAECKQRENIRNNKSWVKRSLHQSRLAIDIFLFMGGDITWNWRDYEFLGEFWESLGGTWGGRWKRRDGVHFQYGGKKRRLK